MEILKLTQGDTKPTQCAFSDDLTGCAIVIQIGFPTPLVRSAVITNGPEGEFEIPWAEDDLQVGSFAADLVITDAVGKIETTDKFQVDVEGRVA